MNTPTNCAEGKKFPITDCPHMKSVEGDTDMNYEHYECKRCGFSDYLDYEEMR